MFSSNWFYSGGLGLGRVVVIGTLAYVALVLMLRVSGKRTLSKMNAFDFIVTVALGSTLATVLLSKDIALAEGGVAFALLIGLQYILTWLSVAVILETDGSMTVLQNKSGQPLTSWTDVP